MTVRPSKTFARVTLQQQSTGRATGLFAALGVLFAFFGTSLLLESVPDSPEVIFILGISLIVAVCIMRWPVAGTYVSVAVTILFDTFQSRHTSTFFSESGIFRNLSYRGLPDGLVVSLFELVVALSLISALVHRFHERKRLVRGPVYASLMLFTLVIGLGETIGLLTGGDFKTSLWEIRPLIYLALLYVLAANTVERASQVRTLMWLTIACIGVRCAEGIWRYFQMPSEIRVSVPTVLEHDDSVFLVIPFSLLLATLLWRRWLPGRLLPILLLLLPIASFVIIINHRRAAFLCLYLIVACLLPLIWVSLQSRQHRTRLVYGMLVVALCGGLYLAVFWNRSGGLAEPARSVRSVFQPDDRDYSSNLYRDQENANLRYTIGLSPLVGIGFGKPMEINTPIVDLREQWSLQFHMPHNNMLWLWMRMGIIGFVLFWMVIGAAVLLVTACLRLGLAKLTALLKEEREARHALPHGATSTPTLIRQPAMLVQLRSFLGARGQPIIMDRRSISKGQELIRSKRNELRQCAEFLTFTFVVLGVFVSLVASAIVDQGLMSFRLTAFSGAMLGALTGIWKVHLLKIPELAPIPQPSNVETSRGAVDARGPRMLQPAQGTTLMRRMDAGITQ